MKCPTCGAESVNACRHRYDDIGCDHPQEIQDVAEAFVDLKKRSAFVVKQLQLLQLKPGDQLYQLARSAALRGWPAFRIAQAYNMPIED